MFEKMAQSSASPPEFLPEQNRTSISLAERRCFGGHSAPLLDEFPENTRLGQIFRGILLPMKVHPSPDVHLRTIGVLMTAPDQCHHSYLVLKFRPAQIHAQIVPFTQDLQQEYLSDVKENHYEVRAGGVLPPGAPLTALPSAPKIFISPRGIWGHLVFFVVAGHWASGDSATSDDHLCQLADGPVD